MSVCVGEGVVERPGLPYTALCPFDPMTSPLRVAGRRARSNFPTVLYAGGVQRLTQRIAPRVISIILNDPKPPICPSSLRQCNKTVQRPKSAHPH